MIRTILPVFAWAQKKGTINSLIFNCFINDSDVAQEQQNKNGAL